MKTPWQPTTAEISVNPELAMPALADLMVEATTRTVNAAYPELNATIPVLNCDAVGTSVRLAHDVALAALIIAAARGHKVVTAQDVTDARLDRGCS